MIPAFAGRSKEDTSAWRNREEVAPPTISLAHIQQPRQNLWVTNMQAHRVHVTIPEDHKVTIEVPADVPIGDAEVIVLFSASVGAPQPADTTFAARFRPNPALGPIVFHEDPTTPVSGEDWPTEHRP